MPVRFLDTSALVKRYVNETGTLWIRTFLVPAPDNYAYIVRLTAVELVAALTRRERGGSLTPADSSMARTAFRTHLATQYQVIEVNEALVSHAMALAETHALRGYDAVQLAAALELNDFLLAGGLSPLTLISADTELNAAAVAEGLAVEDPNQHP